MLLEPIDLQTSNLLLDPNNHRFHDLDGYRRVNEARYHERRVQDKAFALLRDTASFELAELKNSIRTNGYVPLEQIVVSPYPHEEGKYVVVEGNRRVAAVKWLLEDQEAGGVTLDEAAIANLQSLPVVLLDSGVEGNADAAQILMAIRHVSGVKQWGAYQQARLVVELRDRHGSLRPVAEMLGMSRQEVARRYRASKALEQMENDEEFGPEADPKHYGMFHEAVAIPQVREWLAWDDGEFKFTNATNVALFYGLLVEPGDSEYRHLPKIKGYEDVRKLRVILSNPDALEVLFDSSRPLDDAHHIATRASRATTEAAQFDEAVAGATSLIGGLSASALKQLTEEQVNSLRHLSDVIEAQLADREKLIT